MDGFSIGKSERMSGLGDRMKSKRNRLRRAQTIKNVNAKHDYLLNARTWDVFAPPPSNSVKVSGLAKQKYCPDLWQEASHKVE